jgi:hypothetical protein
VGIEEIFHYSGCSGSHPKPLWTFLQMETFLLGYRLNTVPLGVSTLELVYQCDANRIWIRQRKARCSKFQITYIFLNKKPSCATLLRAKREYVSWSSRVKLTFMKLVPCYLGTCSCRLYLLILECCSSTSAYSGGLKSDQTVFFLGSCPCTRRIKLSSNNTMDLIPYPGPICGTTINI